MGLICKFNSLNCLFLFVIGLKLGVIVVVNFRGNCLRVVVCMVGLRLVLLHLVKVVPVA